MVDNWSCPKLLDGHICTAENPPTDLTEERVERVCRFPWKTGTQGAYPRCGVYFSFLQKEGILLNLAREEDAKRFPALTKLGKEQVLNGVSGELFPSVDACPRCAKVPFEPKYCRDHRRRAEKITFLLQEGNGIKTGASVGFKFDAYREGPYSQEVLQMLSKKSMSQRWAEWKLEKALLPDGERAALAALLEIYGRMPTRELEIMASRIYVSQKQTNSRIQTLDDVLDNPLKPTLADSTTIIRASSIDLLYREIHRTISQRGLRVGAVTDPQSVTTGFGQMPMASIELVESTCILTHPRARLLSNPVRPLNIFFAVGQFLWYLSGANDAGSIAYYNARAADFAEDGRITGNAYGYRLTNFPDGRNQLKTIISRLTKDKYSRRAFMPIYVPSDNFLTTREVPCPIGFQLLYRDEGLSAILKMRSSNAATLFPYNVFSFSLLGELCTAQLGYQLGHFYLNAVSLHVLDSDLSIMQRVPTAPSSPEFTMKPIPETTIDSLQPLIDFEKALRYETVNDPSNLDLTEWSTRAEKFDAYWRDFAIVLLSYSATKIGRLDRSLELAEKADPVIAYFVRSSVQRLAQ